MKSTRTDFSFNLSGARIEKDENGKPHLIAVASDNLTDSEGDRFSKEAIDAMVSDAKKGGVRLIDNHRSTVPFGMLKDGSVQAKDDGTTEFLFDAQLDEDFSETRYLMREFERHGETDLQLSVGAFIDHSEDGAIFWENNADGSLTRVLNKISLDHVALTPPGRAANPRTRILSAVSKALDDDGWGEPDESSTVIEVKDEPNKSLDVNSNDATITTVTTAGSSSQAFSVNMPTDMSGSITWELVPVTKSDEVETDMTTKTEDKKVEAPVDEVEKTDDEVVNDIEVAEASDEVEKDDESDETPEEKAAANTDFFTTLGDRLAAAAERIEAAAEKAESDVEEKAEDASDEVEKDDESETENAEKDDADEEVFDEAEASTEFDAKATLLALAASIDSLGKSVKELEGKVEKMSTLESVAKSLDSIEVRLDSIEGTENRPNGTEITKSKKTTPAKEGEVFKGLFNFDSLRRTVS